MPAPPKACPARSSFRLWIARGEGPSPIEHQVHQPRSDLEAHASHLRKTIPMERKNLRWLLRHHRAGRLYQPRVRRVPVTSPAFHSIVFCGPAPRSTKIARRPTNPVHSFDGLPLGESTSPTFRLRSTPCSASQASSSRGAEPVALRKAFYQIRRYHVAEISQSGCFCFQSRYQMEPTGCTQKTIRSRGGASFSVFTRASRSET